MASHFATDNMAARVAELLKRMVAGRPMSPEEAVPEGPQAPAVPPTFPPVTSLTLGPGGFGAFCDGRLQSESGTLWGVMEAPGPDTAAALGACYTALREAVAARTRKKVLQAAFGRVPVTVFDAAGQLAVANRFGPGVLHCYLFLATLSGKLDIRPQAGAAALELTVGAGPGAPRVRLGVVNRLGMTEGRLQLAQTVQEQCSFRATTLAVDAKEAPLEPMSPRRSGSLMPQTRSCESACHSCRTRAIGRWTWPTSRII